MRVVNVRFLNQPLSIPPSIKIRVMNIAMKNETKRPIINVVAKPLIGPVP